MHNFLNIIIRIGDNIKDEMKTHVFQHYLIYLHFTVFTYKPVNIYIYKKCYNGDRFLPVTPVIIRPNRRMRDRNGVLP
jgi:hypothetical protein